MTVYYVFYLLLFLYTEMVYINKGHAIEKQNQKVTLFGFFLIFALLACRHPYMGLDLGWGYNDGYWNSFKRLNAYSWDKILGMDSYLNYERGYIIFNKLVGTIWNEPQFFLAVCALVSLLPIAFFVAERSKKPLLSLCIFIGLPVFHIFFSGLRQGIAIGITVLATSFIEKRKPMLFALTVVVASFFHSSAIVFLVAYPLYYINFANIGRMISLLILPILFVLRGPIFAILSKIFTDNAVVEETGAGTLFIVFVLIYVFLILVNKVDDERQNGLINLCYAACICQAFGGIYNTALRVGYYFIIYMVVAIPNALEALKGSGRMYRTYQFLVELAFIVIFVVYGLNSIQNGSWSRTFPYIWFWKY